MSIIIYGSNYDIQKLKGKNYDIIIDDSAFLWDAKHKFSLINSLAKIMMESGRRLFQPKAMTKNLLNIIQCCSDQVLKRGLENTLNSLHANNLLCLIKINGDGADISREIVAEITKIRMTKTVLFITANEKLAHDVNKINGFRSQYGKDADVLWLGGVSHIANNVKQPKYDNSAKQVSKPVGQNGQPKPLPVSICSTITKIPNEPLGLTNIPGEHTQVTTDNGQQIKLLGTISGGGEGIVYQTDQPGQVAKIYNARNVTLRQQAKIEMMVKNPLRCSGICFPQTVLYNQQRQFVGFLMPLVKGKTLNYVCMTPLRMRVFPNWNKKDLVALCVTIMKKINYLHCHGILIGDINLQNILVETPTDVYFVDCDSYQYGEFPCPVGKPDFTPPELQHKRYDNIMRSKENEYFSIATLLFMLLMNGKYPYSQQGGSDTLTNIVNGQFPYCCGSIKSKNLPVGDWRFIWSNLPRYIKDDFYQVFQKGGEHYLPAQRYSAIDWLNKMNFYLKMLETGRIPDPQMLEIEPARFKNVENSSQPF